MRKRFKKTSLSLTLAASLVIGCIAGGLGERGSAITRASGDETPANPRIEEESVTWDCIYFGNYPQSDATGETKDPIKWRVLAVEGNDAFLLSDDLLDVQQYHPEMTDITWENCFLREWLNTTFLNAAFTESEQQAIMDTTVINDDNPSFGTEGGANTIDKVYLLSSEEARTPSYGFHLDPECVSETRSPKTTYNAYVNAGGTLKTDMTLGGCCWWLRTPGNAQWNACSIIGGQLTNEGLFVDLSRVCVRPVLHLDLSAAVWSPADTLTTAIAIPVDTPPENEETSEPTPSAPATKKPVSTATTVPTSEPEATLPADTEASTSPSPDVSTSITPTPVPTATISATKPPTPAPTSGTVSSNLTPPQSLTYNTPAPTPTATPAKLDKLKTPTVITVKSPGGKRIYVNIHKGILHATGYQVYYCRKKSFKNADYVYSKKNSIYIKNLKKKTYYVRVRAYRVTKGKKDYSDLSKIYKVTVKK